MCRSYKIDQKGLGASTEPRRSKSNGHGNDDLCHERRSRRSTQIRYDGFDVFDCLQRMAQICSLYIINKSGGLIYQKSFSERTTVDLNDRLRIASIWHSVCAIATQISPMMECAGIDLLEADTFDLHCFQTTTGTKFCLVVEPRTQNIPTFLNKLYELYSDFVLKNPFYEVEMPIRCELFDQNVETAVRRFPIV